MTLALPFVGLIIGRVRALCRDLVIHSVRGIVPARATLKNMSDHEEHVFGFGIVSCLVRS